MLKECTCVFPSDYYYKKSSQNEVMLRCIALVEDIKNIKVTDFFFTRNSTIDNKVYVTFEYDSIYKVKTSWAKEGF